MGYSGWICPQAVGVILLGVQLGGCGASNSNATAGGGGTSGSASATAGSSVSGESGTGAGGTASGGASSGGAAGAGRIDCTGDFGTPTTVIAEVDGLKIVSPTVSPDERELIYARVDYGSMSWSFVHASRGSASDPFSAAIALPELDAACQIAEERGVDLSSDGLRAYIVCLTETPGNATLHIADRASLQAPFVVRAKSQHIGGASVAISPDELTLYSNDETLSGPTGDSALQYKRATKSDDFGPAQAIPELSGTNLFALDPSPDGLAMYGGVMSNLGVAKRSSVSENYGMPAVLVEQQDIVGPPRKDYVYGSPELSHDCRSLYFVQQDAFSDGVNGSIWVLKR